MAIFTRLRKRQDRLAQRIMDCRVPRQRKALKEEAKGLRQYLRLLARLRTMIGQYPADLLEILEFLMFELDVQDPKQCDCLERINRRKCLKTWPDDTAMIRLAHRHHRQWNAAVFRMISGRLGLVQALADAARREAMSEQSFGLWLILTRQKLMATARLLRPPAGIHCCLPTPAHFYQAKTECLMIVSGFLLGRYWR